MKFKELYDKFDKGYILLAFVGDIFVGDSFWGGLEKYSNYTVKSFAPFYTKEGPYKYGVSVYLKDKKENN